MPRRRKVGQAAPAPRSRIEGVDELDRAAGLLAADRHDRSADDGRAGTATRRRHGREAGPAVRPWLPALERAEVGVEPSRASGERVHAAGRRRDREMLARRGAADLAPPTAPQVERERRAYEAGRPDAADDVERVADHRRTARSAA